MDMQDVNIAAKFPAGEDKTVFLQRVAQALRGEFGSSATVKVDDEESEVEIIDKDWVAEEESKEEERLKQKKKSDEERRNYDEAIMEIVNKIPDSSLSTLCQLLPPDMRLAKKYEMILEETERKKAELESEFKENLSSKIYGRENSY